MWFYRLRISETTKNCADFIIQRKHTTAYGSDDDDEDDDDVQCNRLSRLRISFRSSPDKWNTESLRNQQPKHADDPFLALHYNNILPSFYNMETITVEYLVSI